jgi:hypothetical protein
MLLAYAIIVGGGVAITRRLRLIEMAMTFWTVFAVFLGVLAVSGHCMTAAWSLTPVCGSRFWTVVVSSPEILIFVFFMITDPKTVPRGRAARVMFSVTLAVLATLLIAPQTVEFGAKVALLGSLVVWSPLRSLFDRYLVSDRGAGGLSSLFERLADPEKPTSGFRRGVIVGSLVVLLGVGVVFAGNPARPSVLADLSGSTPGIGAGVDVDPATLPEVSVHADVYALNSTLDQAGVRDLALVLAENLALEGEAVRSGDGSLLEFADAGVRLAEMQARVEDAISNAERVVEQHTFETLKLQVAGESGQAGAALVFVGSGKIARVSYDSMGVELGRTTVSFAADFVLQQIAGDRWLIVEVSAR